MTEDEFWSLIARSREAWDPKLREGNAARQLDRLEQLLHALTPARIVAFDRQFGARMDEAYRADLWDAATLLAEGCSDDWFEYFRAWLISMGREAYQGVLADPDELATVAFAPGVEDVFLEEMLYVAQNAYEFRTGDLLPRIEPPLSVLAGTRIAEADLPERFPRLWASINAR